MNSLFVNPLTYWGISSSSTQDLQLRPLSGQMVFLSNFIRSFYFVLLGKISKKVTIDSIKKSYIFSASKIDIYHKIIIFPICIIAKQIFN